MALTVEDGTGVAGADSFISVADANTLAADYGITLGVDDAETEIQLRKAYKGLLVIEPDLQGTRTHDTQTGIFPRTGVLVNCVALDSEAITQDMQLAQLYQASAYVAGMESNTVDDGLNLKSFDVKGVYSETYQDGSSQSINSRVQGVYNELYAYTNAGYHNSPCGKGSGYGNGLGREEFCSVGI